MSETELCRLCANVADHTNAQNLFKRNQQKLLRQIEELTGLQLKNAKELPQFICKLCQEQTVQAHEFREVCIQSQNHFATAEYRMQTRAPPIEVVVLHESKPIKQEEEAEEEKEEKDEAPLIKATTATNAEDNNFNADNFNPLAEDDDEEDDDDHNSCGVDMLAIEPEVSLLPEDIVVVVEEKPLIMKNDTPKEIKPRKKLKSSEAQKKPKRKRKKSIYPKEKVFICELCGNTFSLKTNLDIHMLRHAGNRPHQCELCPAKYFTKAILARHMLTHTGEKPWPCRYCDSRFVDSISRVRHERNHTNDRPFVCNECGKAFTQLVFLKNHSLTHTGVRAFDCKLCNAQFKRKTHLVTHFRSIMHKQNEEKHQLLDTQTNAAPPPPDCDVNL